MVWAASPGRKAGRIKAFVRHDGLLLGPRFRLRRFSCNQYRSVVLERIADDLCDLAGRDAPCTVNRPGFRGGSNSREWSHEEVPEVFARGA